MLAIHATVRPAVARFLRRQYERHAAVDPSLPRGLSVGQWIAEASERTMVNSCPEAAAHFTEELLALRQRAPDLYERLARERARLVFCSAGSPATTIADLVLMAVEEWLDRREGTVTLAGTEAELVRQCAERNHCSAEEAVTHLLRQLTHRLP